ncbi:MAG: pre-peptidase C-terminal domain-containing protein, partial [Sterolibacterium sp.]
MATIVESESNNFASRANSLSLGDTAQGSLSSSSDWDFYKLTVPAGGSLKLDFSPPTASDNYYYQIDVFDSSDKLLAENFYGNFGTLSFGLPTAGSYYVAVTSSSLFSSGQYALTVSNGSGSASAYESEANDTLATANSIALAHTIKGQLAGSSDVDCYRVSASTPGVLVVDLVAGKASSGNSLTVDLYDAAGNLLEEQSTGHATTLTIPVSASGDYFIKVKQANNFDGSNYSLTVNNDSFSSLASKVLTESAPLSATLSAAHDWYSVSLVGGKSYEFVVKGATSGGGTLADPALTLCYSTGAVLETCDNLNVWSSSLSPPGATTTVDPQIAFTAPATGTYYLMVTGNGGTGSYTLSENTDTQVDLTQALVEATMSPSYRWNGAAALGTAVSLEYSFLSSSVYDVTDFVAMTDNQKQTVRDVLAMYASIANITFTEVSSQSSADIRFGTSNQDGLSSGVTYQASPNSDGSLRQADVFLNNTGRSASTSTLSPGGYGYLTLIHEIGHALGLKHPGDYDAGDDRVPPPFLPAAFDTEKFTVMSYLDNSDSTTYHSTPALIDIAALQYLYGINTSESGSSHTFSFSNSSAFVTSLLAGGSNDIIDIQDQTVASKIFMLPGSLSSIG